MVFFRNKGLRYLDDSSIHDKERRLVWELILKGLEERKDLKRKRKKENMKDT
jgi:hypothetical protein